MKHRLLFAALLSIVVTLSVTSVSLAQQPSATEIAGGPGGSAFSDLGPEQGARVVEIQVRSGEYIDSLQFVYMLNDGRIVEGPRHGGGGGELSVFRLDSEEDLVGISGRTGNYIDSIQFLTNKRTSQPFGGNGGSREFRLDVPANTRVAGLAGRSGNYLDAIGLTFLPIRRRSYPGFESAPQPGQTSLSGGSGGAPFADADIPAGAGILEVRVKAGEYVDSVQIIYGSPEGRPMEAARHGGGGGREASFRLQRGEYIVGLSGRYGGYVDSLRIHTNLRTSQVFGGGGGDRDFRIDVPDGNQATGFIGRSGEYLDAIGLAYSRTPEPQDRYHERRHNR